MSTTTRVDFCVFPPADSMWTGVLKAYAKTVSHVSTGITSLWIMDSITSGEQLSVFPYLVPPSKDPTLSPVRAGRVEKRQGSQCGGNDVHKKKTGSHSREDAGRRGSHDVGVLTPNSLALSPSDGFLPFEQATDDERTTLVEQFPRLQVGDPKRSVDNSADNNTSSDMDIDTDAETNSLFTDRFSSASLSPPPSSVHSEYLPKDSSSSSSTSSLSKERTASVDATDRSKSSRSSSPEFPLRSLTTTSIGSTSASPSKEPPASPSKRPGLFRGVPLSPSKSLETSIVKQTASPKAPSKAPSAPQIPSSPTSGKRQDVSPVTETPVRKKLGEEAAPSTKPKRKCNALVWRKG